MSENLLEFLKVLTIVVTWSSLILTMRHYMLSLDGSSNEEELPKPETISVKLNSVSVKSPNITNEVTSKDLNSSASRKN
jgi:hypothetical protein